MRVAILCESDIDEDAVRILADALLGSPTEPALGFPMRARGVEFVIGVIPAVVKHLYYGTDAEAFAVVVDSNHKPLHDASHDPPAAPDPECRSCRVRGALASAIQGLSAVPGRPSLKTAVGVAVPAIDAWYRCGIDLQVTEANWQRGLKSRKDPYTKAQLKAAVYGAARPALGVLRARALAEARRLAADLERLEEDFPIGFGSFARDVRGWLADP
jgi:hypothetical protein